MMRKSVFYIDGGPAYIGYTNGDRWNGWATPYFTYEEAQKLQAEFNQGDGLRMFYDCQADKFILQYDDDDEPYIWEGEDIQTVDGKLHLYGIGAYSHIWDEVDGDDKRYLAQTISEFLQDFDPYEWNYQDYDEYEVIDELIAQFANLEVFAKAHTIMNTERAEDEIFTKLKEILHI
jgi:hypothetical protein